MLKLFERDRFFNFASKSAPVAIGTSYLRLIYVAIVTYFRFHFL